MFSVELDDSGRLLRLRFAQHVDRDQAQACATQSLGLLAQAKPSFCLLTDLSQLESMDLACEPIIDQLMDACNRAGIRKIVRVVSRPTQDIGFGIMSLFHYGSEVRIVTCRTLEEAEEVLKT